MEARPFTYVPSPWLRFRSQEGGKLLYCQPDGIDFDINRGLVTIVEFKLQHTPNAWWQTRKLYEPVIRHLFGGDIWKYAIVEIVKWYDPDTAFPEKLNLLRDLSFGSVRPGEFHLHIWNGRD